MTASTKCRAKGGPAHCTNPNCPELDHRRAREAQAKASFFTSVKEGLGLATQPTPAEISLRDMLDDEKRKNAALTARLAAWDDAAAAKADHLDDADVEEINDIYATWSNPTRDYTIDPLTKTEATLLDRAIKLDIEPSPTEVTELEKFHTYARRQRRTFPRDDDAQSWSGLGHSETPAQARIREQQKAKVTRWLRTATAGRNIVNGLDDNQYIATTALLEQMQRQTGADATTAQAVFQSMLASHEVYLDLTHGVRRATDLEHADMDDETEDDYYPEEH